MIIIRIEIVEFMYGKHGLDYYLDWLNWWFGRVQRQFEYIFSFIQTNKKNIFELGWEYDKKSLLGLYFKMKLICLCSNSYIYDGFQFNLYKNTTKTNHHDYG